MQLRRSAGLPEKGRRRGTPLPGWLERTGILSPQQPAAWLWGPLPLVRSRFASLHPHRLLACGYRCFPSLGFELPALTNRCRTASPAPSALRPSGERHRSRVRAGRRQDGSLRRRAPPNGRACSSGRYRRGSPFSSHFILQPCGPRRTQPTIKSAPASFFPLLCFFSGACKGEAFPPLRKHSQLPAGGCQG